jgi:predicted nuclease of predicted toxin-antitoxin system
MTFSEFSFIADENIDPLVINFLRNKSISISSLLELDLIGSSDESILRHAQKARHVILTQDSDFGNLIHTMNLEFYAIVFLRPGHFAASLHIETLESLLKLETQLIPPFIMVAENSAGRIKIRIRGQIGN